MRPGFALVPTNRYRMGVLLVWRNSKHNTQPNLAKVQREAYERAKREGEGEKMAQTFREVLKNVEKLTHFERKHNIKITNIEILVDKDTVKLVSRKTTDGRNGLILFYLASTQTPQWFYWFPNEEQLRFLMDVFRPIKVTKLRNGDK